MVFFEFFKPRVKLLLLVCSYILQSEHLVASRCAFKVNDQKLGDLFIPFLCEGIDAFIER
ncbi:hypothetical protein GAGA_1027 [Paraglaciecola agarilytica NO2]|uniref:Secreted protein n=1 Tax=Paraglaciecola agarilytica NO2 TaxID=1125747 RepID=A0ABQ0I3H2_9ALTE|nr:hypothetical protein GAGA_1027 [Paraglaciecola agarilytica NO2]